MIRPASSGQDPQYAAAVRVDSGEVAGDGDPCRTYVKKFLAIVDSQGLTRHFGHSQPSAGANP